MYIRRLTYELTIPEQERYALDEVVALFDENLNGIVINHPSNGLLAGERIRSRTNEHYDKHQPVTTENRPHTFWFTDDYNALWSVHLAEARRREEQSRMQTMLGQLAIISAGLPQLTDGEETKHASYRIAINNIAQREARAHDPNKKRAFEHLQESLSVFERRGFNVTTELREKVHLAAENLRQRQATLTSQRQRNKERSEILERELRDDQIVKNVLRYYGNEQRYKTIGRHTDTFLDHARSRTTKPGNLTINNAWHRRNEPNSWGYLLLAQDGWEPLYGAMMEPMSRLKNTKETHTTPGEVLAEYTDILLTLEDIIDLSMIGGDYDALAGSLREKLYVVEQLLIDGELAKAKRAAREFRFLLRYRTLDKSQLPEQWYVELPGVVAQPDIDELLTEEEKAKPFHGLN